MTEASVTVSLDLALSLHLATDPVDWIGAYETGSALIALGSPEAAMQRFLQRVARRPGDAAAWMGLSGAHAALGDSASALQCLDRLVSLAPDWAAAHRNRATALRTLGRLDEALAAAEQACTLDPADTATRRDKADLLLGLSQYTRAVAAYDQVIAERPGLFEARVNRAAALHHLRRFPEAIEACQDALRLWPGDATLRFQESLALLASGDYPAGWRGFEARWAAPYAAETLPLPPGPAWLGETPLAGRRLLLVCEYGLGDTLQFCRYARLAAEQGAAVTLRVQAPLVRLLQGMANITVQDEAAPLPAYDLWCPLMSLPLAFDTTLATVPAAIPYLRADPREAAHWRDRLAELPGRRVGLVWAGRARQDNPNMLAIDQRRSMPLQRLAPLLREPGLRFVSLQKGPPAAEAACPPAGTAIWDRTAELHDFAATAALVDALDLVISVDTSTAHLAGAMGKPVWILNRYDTCWRWLPDRTDTPWYPTARLFTQPRPGDWDSVIAAVIDAIRALPAG